MPGRETEPTELSPGTRREARELERDNDRTLRYRLRRVRQERRWKLPLEEELTDIYIVDETPSSTPEDASRERHTST
jgi:hypothetical protein